MRITGMRLSAIKATMLAAGLALCGTGMALAAPQSPAPVAQPVGPAVTVAAPAAPVSAPAPAAAAPAAAAPAANDPVLALDGGPVMPIDPIIGHPVAGNIGLQPQVTHTGVQAAWFHDWLLLPVIVLITLLVLVLLVIVVLRYNRRSNPLASKTSHNTVLEVLWTGLPVLILLGLALPSIGLLQAQYKPAPKTAVTLKAIGNQWYWSYQYPDHGGFEITANMLKDKDDPSLGKGDRARQDIDGPRLLATDNRVVLPVGVPIRLITTSNDVIHSWAIPAFWIKLDAVPGRLNETSFKIDKPGVYFGVCSELCGSRHGYMPIAVAAVSPAVFARWVAAKGGTMPNFGKSGSGAAGASSTSAASAIAAGPPGADAAASTTGPAGQDVTTTGPVRTTGATANPAGAGNVDQ